MAVKQFGATWWGRAWLDALEGRALVDPNRLPRGRTYARQGRVVDLEVEPGLIRAGVEGTDRYTATLGVRRLDDDAWSELVDRVVERAKLAAALLSGEVPAELGETLLPGPGELRPDCNCPDEAEPCKHAAALCYVAADLFDADPFALLLVRGRGREQVLAEIRRRRSAALGVAGDDGADANRPRGADPGTPSAAAHRRTPEPLARSIVAPAMPRGLRPLSTPPPADAGIDEAELRELVADGARRAQAMLVGEAGSQLDLTVGADAARRAIVGDVVAIARATRLPVEDLAAAAVAFHHGGQQGIAMTRQRWEPDPADQDRILGPGIEALRPLVAGGAKPRTRANTVSVGSVQLRVDRAGNWWRFNADDELGWLLAAPPATDPTELL